MKLPTTHITNIKFVGGTELKLEKSSLTALVGPNNSGKTTALKEILNKLASNQDSDSSSKNYIIESVTLQDLDSKEEKENFCDSLNRVAKLNQHNIHEISLSDGTKVSEFEWQVDIIERNSLGRISQFYIEYDDPLTRPTIVDTQQQQNRTRNIPISKLEKILDDNKRKELLTNAIRVIFNCEITIDKRFGDVCLRLGKELENSPRMNEPIPSEVKKQLDQRPKMEKQGLGMRSAIGMLISLIDNDHNIHLIDEPEAFLHPPQAKRLGSELAKLSLDLNKQVIVSTHDRNILDGILHSPATCNIISLSRDESQKIKIIPPNSIQKFKQSKFARYSYITDAIFHQQTWVVESDSDAYYFRAAIEYALNENNEIGGIRHPDEVLMITCAGKNNIFQAVEFLRLLHVQPIVIADFDMINDSKKLKCLTDKCDIEWCKLEYDFNDCASFFNAYQIDSCTSYENSKMNGWKLIKNLGVRARSLPQSCLSLLSNLAEHGIYIVPYGELEDFGEVEIHERETKSFKWVLPAVDAETHGNKKTQLFVKAVLAGEKYTSSFEAGTQSQAQPAR